MAADVTVIGAGYGGLTAAAILAHRGVEVEVLEATGHPGGRAAFDSKNGFMVDYGIHANRYGAQGAAAAALREIGHEMDFISMGEPLLWREGSFVPLPNGVPQFLKAKFFSLSDKAVMIGDMIKLVTANVDKIADVPLSEAVWGLSHPEIESIFTVLSGIGMVCPDLSVASAGAFSWFLKTALKARESVAYPLGGTSQIINTLVSKIEEKGKVSYNSRARSIDISGGKVTSVKVKEESRESKAVIVAVPLQKLPELAPGISPDLARRCESIVATGGVSIDLCLSKRVSDVDGLVVTPDPVTMGQFTSNFDPSTAPEGKQLGTWYYPMPVDLMDDRNAVDAGEKKLREMLEEMFPGILDNVEWERVLRLKMVDGFEPRVGQTAKDRPGHRVPGVENMFLAGDAVASAGTGGDVAFGSGVAAAKAACEYLS